MDGDCEMKQFIVLCSMVILGIAIYQMIMGTNDDTVISVVSDVWKNGIAVRTNTP